MLPPTTVEMFECLLEDIAERLEDSPRVEHMTPDQIALFIVTTSWLETATRYGDAIRVILAENQQGGVGPLERALFEMWINWKYLLDHTLSRERSAEKVLLIAKLEALELVKGEPDVRKSTVESCQSELDTLVGLYPEAHAEVLSQRKQRRWTWSGISYSAMERKIAPGSVLYKLFSWDSHATIGTSRDVRIKTEGGKATFSFGRKSDDPMANPARVARSATEVLYHMFEGWRELWKLPPLHPPRVRL